MNRLIVLPWLLLARCPLESVDAAGQRADLSQPGASNAAASGATDQASSGETGGSGQTGASGATGASGDTGASGENPIGPAPSGATTTIAALEVRNDLAYSRADALAYSSIAIPRALNLTNTSELVLIDAATNARVQAQLRPIARWNGTVTDATKPIQWLQIALKANVAANATSAYELRRIAGATPVNAAGDVTLLDDGASVTIDTGAARFVLGKATPALFTAITVGGVNVLGAGASGPFVVDDGGNSLVPSVDAVSGFVIEEQGPVKTVIRTAGHFARVAPTGSSCTADLAYTARFTFVRNSSAVSLELDLRNECGDGFAPGGDGGSWWNQFYRLRRAGWRFATALTTKKLINDATVYTTSADARLEQEYGSVANASWRRARVMTGATEVWTGEALGRPLLALVGADHSLAVTQAWMRYREPAALSASAGGVSIELVSDTIALGEAQARWGFAQLRFFSGSSDATLQAERDAAIADVERGLLVRASATHTNAAFVASRLPERNVGHRLQRYVTLIEKLHADTISGWRRAKRFGMVWPDTHERNADSSIDQTSAEETVASSNYWSATSSELAEYLRTGDPRFFWDMAYPMEHNMMKTAVYDTGTRTPASTSRLGFHAGSSTNANQREGKAYRQGYNTDDYLYDQGTDEAYILRPTGSLLDVFARACRSAIARYPNAATLDEQMTRDEYLAQRRFTRGTVQHFNMLRYAAAFVTDPALAEQCETRLHEIVQELAVDNFFAGIACSADFGNATSCTTNEHFMYSALFHDFLDDYARRYAGSPLADTVRNTIVTMGRAYYDTVMTKQANGEIDVGGAWGSALTCSFSGGVVASCSNEHYAFSALFDERANHTSVLLMSNALAPLAGRCSIGARALTQALDSGALESSVDGQGFDVGWWKGASQNMRNAVYGVGVAEACDVD